MMTGAELPIEQRILQLFQHLGISRAHIASRMPQDVDGSNGRDNPYLS